MRWPLQVPKLDLVGGVCAPDLHGELHLQELVSLLPLNLDVVTAGHHHGQAEAELVLPHCAAASSLPGHTGYNKTTQQHG